LFRIKEGDNETTIEKANDSITLVKTRTIANKAFNIQYLMVEPVYIYRDKFYRVEIQGEVEKGISLELAKFLEAEEVVDKQGDHILWSLKIKDIKKYTLSISKKQENANLHQNFMLRIFDVLHRFGFSYSTGHIFIISYL